VLPLTFTTKLSGGCTVTDAGGAVVLQINVPLFRPCPRRVLLDPGRVPLLSVERKQGFGQASPVWHVFRGDRNNESDLLFTVNALSMRASRLHLNVFLAENTAQDVADFRIKGDFSRSCYFYLGNYSDVMIASMNHLDSFGRRMFGVSVFPQVDYAFITTLVVILCSLWG
ncbi:hypothetical protein EJB05_13397, partial [Eragrostis curvula]